MSHEGRRPPNLAGHVEFKTLPKSPATSGELQGVLKNTIWYYLILSYHEYEISEMSLQWIWKSVSSWFIRLSSSPLGSAFQIAGGQKIYAVSKSCDSWLHPIYIWGISPWFCLPVAATLGSTSIQFCEHRPRSRHPNMSKSERPHDSVGGWRSCGPEKSICDGYPNGYPNGLQCFSSSVFYYKN